eukprot:1356434-Rhodomonas_salina.1
MFYYNAEPVGEATRLGRRLTDCINPVRCIRINGSPAQSGLDDDDDDHDDDDDDDDDVFCRLMRAQTQRLTALLTT